MTKKFVPALGETTSYADFVQLGQHHRVIPVMRTLLADAETSLSIYTKLAHKNHGSFLLESAEEKKSWSRWSFVGVRNEAILTMVDHQPRWIGRVPDDVPHGDNPLTVLSETLALLQTPEIDGSPPLTSGFVGFFSYDMVRWKEKLPELTVDDLQLPDLCMILLGDLVAIDSHEGTVTLISNAINWNGKDTKIEQAYQLAVSRLDQMTAKLTQPSAASVGSFSRVAPQYSMQRSCEEYSDIVRTVIEDIKAGEAFQVVPSFRFETECTSDPLDVYRMLRIINPSPYMYLVNIPELAGNPGYTIVGSSPESLVKVQDRQITTLPIAGTRPRGADDDEDLFLEKQLLADEKENAEHLMLVDLGRNDLGRVCQPGSVHVSSFAQVEYYSHVMHLVSRVTGTLAYDKTVLDAVMSCFPAGTLSGAPKVRAMEIIEAHELTRRGLYGGVIGYFDLAGNADLAIAIRTGLIKNGKAYVQAGGGVVIQSDPIEEFKEANNKARAVLSAIAAAATLRGPSISQEE